MKQQKPTPLRSVTGPHHANRVGLCLSQAVAVLALLAIGSLPAQQGSSEDPQARPVIRVVQDASRAIQALNPAGFLHFFDRERFKEYAALESNVVALTTQSEIASSIQIVEMEQTGQGYRLGVDWLLELTLQGTPSPLETRHEVLRLEISPLKGKKKDQWRITALAPVDFFRPQGGAPPEIASTLWSKER